MKSVNRMKTSYLQINMMTARFQMMVYAIAITMKNVRQKLNSLQQTYPTLVTVHPIRLSHFAQRHLPEIQDTLLSAKPQANATAL